MKKRHLPQYLLLLCFLTIIITNAAHGIEVTFYNLDEMAIASAPTAFFQDAPLEITNETSEIWTDFHMRLSFTSPTGIIEDAGPNLYFSDYEGPGSYILYDPGGRTNPFTFSQIDIFDIAIGVGEALEFAISGGKLGEGLPNPGGSWVYANPTTDGQAPIPEPATMLLLGTGLIGLAGLKRKRLFKK